MTVSSNLLAQLRAALPGLALVALVAAVARLSAPFRPAVIGEILVAVLLGILIANLTTLPAAFGAGIRLAVQRLLRVGIVLLGARLSLGDVAAVGGGAFGLVILCMAVALAFALAMGRAFGLQPNLSLLIAVGTAVCGNSAIVATAPVIQAKEREVSFAVATITLFGTLAVFFYPLVGHALQLGDGVFGVWAGIAVNDTSQVVAASAAYSPEARDTATVVKLVRNALMAPLIVGIAWWAARRTTVRTDKVRAGALRAFPLFVLGFLGMALLRTVGLIDPDLAARIDGLATLFILLALAGVGLSTRLAQMKEVGFRPFQVGMATAAVLGLFSLALISALGIAPGR
jgi:uncharacterized integral membrane protein (TIGR00698 family)